MILSLEMHCSLPQQERIAAILREVLGERLHLPPSAAAAAALSPAELRGKVIVKGKRLPFLLSQDISRDQLEQGRAEHDSDDSGRECSVDGGSAAAQECLELRPGGPNTHHPSSDCARLRLHGRPPLL